MILDFSQKLAEKREKEDSKKKEIFFVELLAAATKKEKHLIHKSLRENDKKAYLKVTEPIIYRIVERRFCK